MNKVVEVALEQANSAVKGTDGYASGFGSIKRTKDAIEAVEALKAALKATIRH